MQHRARFRHLGLELTTALVLLFALGPVIAIVTFSFNTSRFYALPIQGLTLRWYEELLSNNRIWMSFLTSLQIAIAVTILASILGTSFAFFVVRARGRFKAPLVVIGFLPLIVPALVVVASLQVAFVKLDLPLGYVTVIFGHTIYATPFVALMVMAQLFRYDPALDSAARDLGAGPVQTLIWVTLPILWPSIRSGAILAFLLSFNEWAIAFFTGRGFNTLPMLVYSMERNGLPPAVLAYSALSVLVVVGLSSTLLPFILRILRPKENDD